MSQVKPGVADLPGAAARPRPLLDHGDVRAQALQPQRRRQPAQSCADDDRPHRRCPLPSAAEAGAPAAHVATRSCAITVRDRLARPVGLGRDQERPREPARDRAEREALGHVDAVAQPAGGDHRQPRRGADRAGHRRRRRNAPVPEGGGDGAGAAVPPALDQRPVRPARAGHVDRGDARGGELAHVLGIHPEADLLDDDRPRREPRRDRRDPVRHAREGRLPLGLDRLLDRVEVDRQAVGVEQLDEPLGARRRARAAHLRGAEVREQQRRPRPARRAGRSAAAPGSSSSGRPGAEHERDPVLRRGGGEPRVDLGGLVGPAGHRRDDQRRAERRAEQLAAQAHVGQVAAGQRAVAEPHGVQPGVAGVLDAGPGGDAEMVGLAAAGGSVHRHLYGLRVVRGQRLAAANPRSSSRSA